MGIVLQIGLFIAGVWLLSRTVLRIGNSELRSPQTIFAGLVLALQLPIGFGVGFAIGGAERIIASREGLDAGVASAKFAKKYWWLDLAVPGVAIGVAGLMVLTGLRPIEYAPPPPDEPVGITDHRAVMAEKWSSDTKANRDRQRRIATYEDDEHDKSDSHSRLVDSEL
ncbi:hypothetical protein BH11PLA2_BH11PLA2_25830 [soil metagenome]